MTSDHDLDLLTARLRGVASRVDPVPASVTASARAAFAWRTVDAELAELTYDSWVDDRALAGVRGTAGARQLTFEAPGLTVEIEVGDGGRAPLVGQLVPAHPATVQVRHRDGSETVEVDDLGRFAVEHLPSGPISLRCTGQFSSLVETQWVTV